MGWRNGIYVIVPSLLVDMAPVPEAVGIQCLDTFLGNVMVGRGDEGSIKTVISPAASARWENEADEEGTEGVTRLISKVDPNVIGPAIPAPPDIPVTISFGPPTHSSGPYFCLRATVKGSIIVTIGIKDVLYVLAASRGEPSECSHNPRSSVTDVFTLKPSLWATRRRVKPVHPRRPTFIPVQGDRAWTIFLAAEVWWQNGRIVYRCVECALELLRKAKVDSSEEEDEMDVDDSNQSGTDVSWRTFSSDDDDDEGAEGAEQTVLIGYQQLLTS
ncbi:MAG: hypothetical protein M1816_002287 [Peltula sp. TS41687]|nr:MAG: hypothetical protein M1816_002287 [Peltula sp. TS41687]